MLSAFRDNLFLQVILLLLIDAYIYTAIGRTIRHFAPASRKLIKVAFWTLTFFSVTVVIWYNFSERYYSGISTLQWMVIVLAIFYGSKFFVILLLLIRDLMVALRRVFRYDRRTSHNTLPGKPISRSEFFDRAAMAAGIIPFGSLIFGIVSGATDYRVVRKTIYLPHLPRQFDGIRIGQFSDTHAGTFFDYTGVRGGVDMLMREKADVIFFTGDLVNYQTDEINDYIHIFETVRAPMGVFATTGNHDYGNYRKWPSEAAKRKNLEELFEAHRLMGYDLLMNEHRFLTLGGERIAIIGVENWGMGPPHRFPKYGRLADAYKGTGDAAVRLLLSHDPSHWDAQIRPEFPDIDITFSGHTHGFQAGIEAGDFRWSPSQYVYKQWAGLYRENDQYLYVNRGYGCTVYPGRLGMPPEITVIELKRG